MYIFGANFKKAPYKALNYFSLNPIIIENLIVNLFNLGRYRNGASIVLFLLFSVMFSVIFL